MTRADVIESLELLSDAIADAENKLASARVAYAPAAREPRHRDAASTWNRKMSTARLRGILGDGQMHAAIARNMLDAALRTTKAGRRRC